MPLTIVAVYVLLLQNCMPVSMTFQEETSHKSHFHKPDYFGVKTIVMVGNRSIVPFQFLLQNSELNALVSHRCSPGLIPGVGMCDSLWSSGQTAGFSLGTPFSFHSKTTETTLICAKVRSLRSAGPTSFRIARVVSTVTGSILLLFCRNIPYFIKKSHF